MAKQLAKYFIAVVPEGNIQKEVTDLKNQLMEHFGLKYSLKSPAHVTLKMPFSWDEKKEDKLFEKLETFISAQAPFVVQTKGFDRFGRRVLFVKILKSHSLQALQKALSKFCKQELKLVEELSDRNYHPHMTVAFKDVKEKDFELYEDFVKEIKMAYEIPVNQLALLKKIEEIWIVIKRFEIKKAL
jgi:2'-5' RNA ligase